MPKLRQALEQELDHESAFRTLREALLEGEVVEILLATGSPCESHAGAFAAWPGVERDVTKWFRLADGSAVGLRCRDGVAHAVALWEQERDG